MTRGSGVAPAGMPPSEVPLLYSAPKNAMTRDQYALPADLKRTGMVGAGDREARNSPAEQPGERRGHDRRALNPTGVASDIAPVSGPTVGL